jgi:hypothetical protein
MILREHLQNRWVRKATFLAVNACAALAAFALLVMPVRDFFGDREATITRQRDLLARLSAIASQEPRVQSASRQAAEDAKRGELLAGPNEGVISADLQTRLKTMAEQAGARLRSVQSLPAISQDQVRYVGSRLEMFGPLRSVQRALHAIETGRPYLFVTGAAIKQSAGGQNPREEPVIEARLDIFGAVQAEDKKAEDQKK